MFLWASSAQSLAFWLVVREWIIRVEGPTDVFYDAVFGVSWSMSKALLGSLKPRVVAVMVISSMPLLYQCLGCVGGHEKTV